MKKILALLFLIIFLPVCACDFFQAQQIKPNDQPVANLNLSQPLDSGAKMNSLPATAYNEIAAAVKTKAVDWVDAWKIRNSAFNPDNFILVKSASFELGSEKEYSQTLSALEKRFYTFSPDQTRYLDVYGKIDVYEREGRLLYENSIVEFGNVSGADLPDPNYREAAIVDVTKSVARPFTGIPPSSRFDKTIWLSDWEFVLVGNLIVDQGLIPFISYFDLQKMTYFEYDAELVPSCKMVGNCPEDMMTVKVFYTGCPSRITKEYQRQLPKTTEVAKAALNELLNGPYSQEMEAGQEYILSGPNYIILKDIKIIDNIAYVNLNDIRSLFTYDGPYAGMENITLRNCEEFSFFEQATKTLKQFSNIKDAIYFIEGETDLFYNFLNVPCPDNLCQNNPFKPTMKRTYIFYNECHDPVRGYMRLIPQDSEVIKATLKELFQGPAKHETQPVNRYYMFNQWTADILKDVVIKNNIAYVNLANFTRLVPYPDYECNAPQFFASVGETLMQFPEIKDAIYFINGSQENFYKYMKVECPYPKDCAINPFE